MTISSFTADHALALRIVGRLDALTAPEFQEVCEQAIGPGIRKLVLDFDRLDYISSAGLRAILVVGKALQTSGGTLALSGLHGTVRTVLELGGFLSLYPVCDSVEAALESE